MGFNTALTATLTGATVNQLHSWRRKNLFIPEISSDNPFEYSFRDLVALRTIARLRAHTSFQRIRRAIETMSEYEMSNHLSEYKFATDGKEIKVWTDCGFLNLNETHKGQYEFYGFETIYEPFYNMNGKLVPDFQHPKPHLSVNPDRLGGFPTIRDSRIPYSDVVELYLDGDLEPGEIAEFYPQVSDNAAIDAVNFHQMVLENA